jgi:hypothetical protein
MKLRSHILTADFTGATPFISTTFTTDAWSNGRCIQNGMRVDFPYIDDKETAIEFAMDLEEMLCVLYEYIDGEYR